MSALRPRIIARLDIKNDHVIKGIHLEGLRKVGDPLTLASRYYNSGADEIMFMDAVAALYDRNSLFDLVKIAASKAFIPISLGGGIRTLDDASKAFDAGADKIIVNTAAVKNVAIINKIASRYGSQAMVASIQAKKSTDQSWQAYTDNGREPSGLDVLDWTRILIQEGAGEISITSVDQEGTQKGFDIQLARNVVSISSVPVNISGGCGCFEHVHNLIDNASPSGISIASCFHYNKFSPDDLKNTLQAS